MSMVTSDKLFLYAGLAITAFWALLVPFLDISLSVIALLIIISYIALLLWRMPLWGLYALIIIRPSLDILTEKKIISLAGFSLNFASLLAIFAVAAGLYYLLKSHKYKRLPIKWSWILFLIVSFSTIIFSFNKASSLAECARLLSIFSIYFLGYLLIENKKDLSRLLRAIVISVIVPVVFAVYQYITQAGISLPFEGIYNRIYGTFAHPNLFAYYLLLPISILLFVAIKTNLRKSSNALMVAFLPVLLILLVLTYTRGAWLAFLIILAVFGLFKYRSILIIGGIAIAIAYFMVPSIHDRVINLVANPYSSVSWRIELWKDSIGYIKGNESFGYGVGTAKELILNKRGESFGSSDPHNDYLKIALESGLVGLGAYLLLISNLFLKLLTSYRRQIDDKFKTLTLLIISLATAFYIMSFADNIIRNTALMWSFWAMLGGFFAVIVKNKNNINAASQNSYSDR